MVIADSKNMKKVDTVCKKGYDAGKKYRASNYIWRLIPADVTDRDGALEALRAYAPNLTRVVKVLEVIHKV